MRAVSTVVLLGLAASSCGQRDIRAEQQQECRQVGGVYHTGKDWDDDVCVISREKVIIFDNREAES
jgi:hypothetical protein